MKSPLAIAHAHDWSCWGFQGEKTTQAAWSTYARWYQPETGTFLTRDPYPGVNGVPASRHPYQYALNAPTQYTDPSGNCPWCIAVAGGAAISAGIEYGSQVYGNYQNGMSGSTAWTSVDGRALGQAALQGAIEGGVGGWSLRCSLIQHLSNAWYQPLARHEIIVRRAHTKPDGLQYLRSVECAWQSNNIRLSRAVDLVSGMIKQCHVVGN